ncbi:MAG TPA: hypothetical protein VMR52_06870 [Dehalococcoidia bacterium]|nr:hypothetical protein [Dehalococcoidia bacterium]
MTTEEIIIAIVRILGSLPVLAWPFPGAIFAILIDLSDLFLKDLIDAGGVRDYQEFDKWLDQVYMLTFLVVALRWERTPRNIAVGLYMFRLVGFLAFEATQERDILIFVPNLFEFWFVFVAGVKFFRLDDQWRGQPAARGLVPYRYGRGQLAAVLPVLLAVKLLQEFALHVGKWFDSFTATEAVEWIWRFLTPF